MSPDQIRPGPCCSEGCPHPTEIDCIQVTKVYDFCFQTDTRDNLVFDIPASCGTIPPGATATATVTSITCTTTNVAPIGGSGGFANVTLAIVPTLSITIKAPDGTVICTFTGDFMFMKTVTLCAPTGVTITCETPSSAVTGILISDGNVILAVSICVLIESLALVKLLVPTYGFCVPAPCTVLPNPPFTCPPDNLYPPQCPAPCVGDDA